MISIIAVGSRKIKEARLFEPNTTFGNGCIYWLWDSLTYNYMKCSHSELVDALLKYKDLILNARLSDNAGLTEIKVLSGVVATFVRTKAVYVKQDGAVVIMDHVDRKLEFGCYMLGISLDSLVNSDYYMEPEVYTGSLFSCDLECGLIGEVRKKMAYENSLEEKTNDSHEDLKDVKDSESMVEENMKEVAEAEGSDSDVYNTLENHSTVEVENEHVESTVHNDSNDGVDGLNGQNANNVCEKTNSDAGCAEVESVGAVLSREESLVNAEDNNRDKSNACDGEHSQEYTGVDTSEDMRHKDGNLNDTVDTQEVTEESHSDEEETSEIEDNSFADVCISDKVKERFSISESDFEDGSISTEMLLAHEIDNDMHEEFEFKNGLPDCPLCHGNGYYIGDFGIKIRCNCATTRTKSIAYAKEAHRRAKAITSGDTTQDLVTLGVIRKSRMNDYYSKDYTERFIGGLLRTFDGCIAPVQFRENFYATANKLIVDLRQGNLPSHSYFMSAPNGCGKETLANTLIKLAYSNNMKVVPYKSLIELTDLKNEYTGKIKDRKELIDPCNYSFSDYVDADLVCCYMASGDPRVTANAQKADDIVINEFSTLETLLKLRAYRDKPTLIFSDRRIAIYRALRSINSSFMYNMYTSEERFASMDRFSEAVILFGVPKEKIKR